ncbi:dethiobiotin synthase [Bacillus xiapuensis]|uniref:dethiobiotin synthase n=1 Tax=Bacillus xiapuensis TaxID=2014075 RepID=UPI000C24053E|nr:dethiobiotin synthase [Bacillus xiapuensis]
MSGFFITGTDTDAGKTIATLLLTHALLEKGVKVRPYKPVQSGAEERDGKLVAPDAELYKLLPALHNEELSSYLYKKASSPHLAAEKEGREIPVDRILEEINERANGEQWLLVEGAGGLYVPLNRRGYCMIDLMEALKFPVVVAARASLGTINHAMLTAESLKNRGLRIAGFILSSTVPEDEEIEKDSRSMIEQLSGLPVIGKIPYVENISARLTDEVFRSAIVRGWKIGRLQEVMNSEHTAAL